MQAQLIPPSLVEKILKEAQGEASHEYIKHEWELFVLDPRKWLIDKTINEFLSEDYGITDQSRSTQDDAIFRNFLEFSKISESQITTQSLLIHKMRALNERYPDTQVRNGEEGKIDFLVYGKVAASAVIQDNSLFSGKSIIAAFNSSSEDVAILFLHNLIRTWPVDTELQISDEVSSNLPRLASSYFNFKPVLFTLSIRGQQ